jgi:hypothetical protein
MKGTTFALAKVKILLRLKGSRGREGVQRHEMARAYKGSI